METQNGEASGTVNGNDPVTEELRERFAPPNIKTVRFVELYAKVENHVNGLRAEAEATPDETPATQPPAETPPILESAPVKRPYKTRVYTKPSKTPVRWTPAEQKKVVAYAAAELRRNGIGVVTTIDDRSGGRRLLDAFRMGQRELLPPNRQKSLKFRVNLEIAGLLDDLAIAFKQPPPKKQEEEAQPTPPSAKVDDKKEVCVNHGTAGVALTVQSPPDSSIAKLFIDAATTLVRAFEQAEGMVKEAKEVNALLLEEIDGLRKRVEANEEHLRAIDKEDRRAVGNERAKLPTVAILGCRKDEFDSVVTKALERGLKLELRHYEQDSKPRPVNCDWAVSMKFINHSWNAHLLACVQRGQHTLVRGGINQVVQQLEIWFGAAENV